VRYVRADEVLAQIPKKDPDENRAFAVCIMVEGKGTARSCTSYLKPKRRSG